MYRIIYLSSIAKGFNENDLKAILDVASVNNKINNITGFLFLVDGNFIQVLEGEKEKVLALYEKISTDNRHKGIMKVVEDEIEKRQFENWKMGFSKIEYSEISKIQELQDLKKEDFFKQADQKVLVFVNSYVKEYLKLT